MNKLIYNYNKALHALYEHVGFTPDYVVYAIDDCTGMWWSLTGSSTFSQYANVKYADSEEELKSDDNYYEDEIYTQRFYDKWIYEGKDFTMIFCNPHVDGVNWFRVFDNKKRIK